MIPRMSLQENLAALHGDRRNIALLDIATTFAIMAGVIYFLIEHPGPWSFALAFCGIGLMQYRIVIACHEAVHKTLLFPLWLNEAAGSVQCALVGVNLHWYRRQHLGHHAAQDIAHDTDAYIYAPILRARPGLHRIAIWIFGTAGEIVQKLQHKSFPVRATAKADGRAWLHSVAIVVVQALLLTICTLYLSWWYYFAFWLLPLLTIAIFMNRTRVLLEHGFPHGPQLEGSVLSMSPVQAIDVSAGYLAGFFIAPYKMNFHFAHHRVPSIPHYRNRDLSRLLLQDGGGVSTVESPSYFQALLQVLWK